jgi:hypothetical protein
VGVPDAVRVGVAVGEAPRLIVRVGVAEGVGVLEVLAEAVALKEAESVRALEDEAVAEAEEEAVRVPSASEADARSEETAEGDAEAAALRDAEEDTVGVQELAPHCTGAGASPPKSVPAAAALCVAKEALAGTPVTLNRSIQFIASSSPPNPALAHAVHAPAPHSSHATHPGPSRPPLQRVTFASNAQLLPERTYVNASSEPALSSQKRSSREGLVKPPDVHCSADASACDAENPVPGSSASALLAPEVGAAAPPTVSSPRKPGSAVR